jgi:aminoglycoside phosphotransferase (APT) family kinase protein
MTNAWDADVDLSPALAARLIGQQFPELAPVTAEEFGVGWDNAAYLVNGRYVFRFPRRKALAHSIGNEIRILPLLAPHLPLPIPAPKFSGVPAGSYPYDFAGYPLIPGTTACRVDWTEEGRAANAAPLGRFLRTLHAIAVDEETRSWASGDEQRKADVAWRAPQMRDRLMAQRGLPTDLEVGALVDLIDQLATTPLHDGPPCWVHGDLYARHLLVGEDRRLCAVIDWGDTHLGDPALDLSITWSFLPPSARPAFREAYGPIDDARWNRARFRALFYGAPLIEYGVETGDEAMRRAGEYALRAVLQTTAG